MHVLVTGASGHVGGNLVRVLLQRGDSVRVLVHDDAAAIEALPVERIWGDVTDAGSAAAAVRDVEVVYHLAAVISILGDRDGLLTRVNVEGVRTMSRAAREAGVRRFVHMSSCHAFDLDHATGVIDEHTPRPKASDPFYNRSKALGEAALREQIDAGLDAVVVNPTGVIGPWDFRPSRMGRFFLAMARGHLPALVQGGFDFVDVRDLVRTTLAAAERGRTGENYLVGGRYCRVTEIAAMAAEVLGRPLRRPTVPMWLARAGAPVMDTYGRVTRREPLYTSESLHALRGGRIASDKAAAELGHSARPTADTVRDTYAWFEANGKLHARG